MVDIDVRHITEAPETLPGLPGGGQLRAGGKGRLPLARVEVEAHIVGLTATSRVRQHFFNPTTETLEVTYIFPLPGRCGATAFEATLGGRRVVGQLKERAAARLAYEEAIAGGRRAAIAEEDRAEVFATRVGNLLPGETATLELTLTGPLAFEDGEATFRFPLVVAPRYTSGLPVAGDPTGAGAAYDTDVVPDASRVTPPLLGPGDERPELDLVVHLAPAGLPISDLASSLRTAVVADGADETLTLRAEAGQALDRDFILRFKVTLAEPVVSAAAVPDPEGDEGTWSVSVLTPPEQQRAQRDVVVVLDRSGSMQGWKITAARRAACRVVDSLDAADRFAVMGFDDQVDWFDDGTGQAGGRLLDASDRHRYAAVRWLSALEARGGTEMEEALYQAAALLRSEGRGCRYLVVVTDGQVTGEDAVLARLTPVIEGITVYCVGIDEAVNAGLLQRLASAGRGRCELVESEQRLDDALARVQRSVLPAVLTELTVSGRGVELIGGATTPERPPDAFAGAPCTIYGRYRGNGAGATLEVRGRKEGGQFHHEIALGTAEPTVARPADNPAVRTIWARAKVRDMEDRYAAGRLTLPGEPDALAEEIVRHSLRFGVLSRFTAFVAVGEATDAGSLVEVVQPVEVPSGWAVPYGAVPYGAALAAAPMLGAPAPTAARAAAGPFMAAPSAGPGAAPGYPGAPAAPGAPPVPPVPAAPGAPATPALAPAGAGRPSLPDFLTVPRRALRARAGGRRATTGRAVVGGTGRAGSRFWRRSAEAAGGSASPPAPATQDLPGPLTGPEARLLGQLNEALGSPDRQQALGALLPQVGHTLAAQPPGSGRRSWWDELRRRLLALLDAGAGTQDEVEALARLKQAIDELMKPV